MPKKIKLYDTGDCVEVSTWDCMGTDGLFKPGRAIGLVLEAVYVEMDNGNPQYKDCDGHEWMYRVSTPDGRILEVWDYEIRPVNVMGKEYNTISQQALEKKNGSEHTKRT